MATLSVVPTSRRRSTSRAAAGRVAALALLALSWPVAVSAKTPTHVACVGDSITAGYGASSTNASYPSVLQKTFGTAVMVKNFGHSGATLLSVGDLPYQMQSEYTAATSFVSSAGATAAVAVVLMLGTNDAKPQNWMSGGRAAQMRTDAAALIDHFTQLGTHPTVYLALPPRSYSNSFGIDGTVLHEDIEPLLREVAASKSVATIDVYTPTANDMKLFSDGVHPTDAGYTLLATIIHDALLSDTGGAGGAGGGGGSVGAGGRSGGAGGRGGMGVGGAGPGGRGGPTGGVTGTGGSGTGGVSGSGGSGMSGAGSGGSASGGSGSGGAGMGDTGSGGAATGGSPVGTGGVGTGGMSAGSGGQSMSASGGAMASSSGGAPATTGTGGSHAGGGETNGSAEGCSCALGGHTAGGPPASAALLGLAWLVARARRRDDERRSCRPTRT